MKKHFILFAAVIFSLSLSAQKTYTTSTGQNTPEIGIDEHLNSFVPKDVMVVNEKGDTVNFASLFNKPTILNLVYYRCPGICSPVMNSLTEVIQKMGKGMVIGKDFQVLTVSFNHYETTEVAVKKKKNYLSLLKVPIDASGWQYFTADSMNIQKLTQSVGFRFKQTGEDYLHPGCLIIFSPEGKLTRYFYGTYFLPFEVKLALVEASKGMAGPTINNVLQFCYSYDPEGRQYVLNVTKISGTLILFIGLVIFLVLVFKPKRKQVITNKES
jgi:protein SCO1/2